MALYIQVSSMGLSPSASRMDIGLLGTKSRGEEMEPAQALAAKCGKTADSPPKNSGQRNFCSASVTSSSQPTLLAQGFQEMHTSPGSQSFLETLSGMSTLYSQSLSMRGQEWKKGSIFFLNQGDPIGTVHTNLKSYLA